MLDEVAGRGGIGGRDVDESGMRRVVMAMAWGRDMSR